MPKISIKQLIFTGFSPIPKTHSKFKQLYLAQYCKLVLSECNDLYFIAIAFIAPKTASVQVFWGHSENNEVYYVCIEFPNLPNPLISKLELDRASAMQK
jgi:hypothetical protein